MNAEVRSWLRYAGENLATARLCYENGLYNPCLQNAQQAIEKSLKALGLSRGMSIRKTHSMGRLTEELRGIGAEIRLTNEECELLDSIYLPSKYPLDSVLPDFHPDEAIALRCKCIAERVLVEISKKIEQRTT